MDLFQLVGGCFIFFFFWGVVYIQKWNSWVIMVVLFLAFWETSHTVFHSDWTNLHSHQQCTRVSFSPYPCQHLSYSFWWEPLRQVQRDNLVVLICSSLMISNGEHLLICLLAICMFSLETNSSTNFLIGLFTFLMFEWYEVFIYIECVCVYAC